MWIKYRHKWAWGTEKRWNYVEFKPKELEVILEEITKRNDWSDKYRGINYVKVKGPPLEDIRERIERHKRLVRYHTKQLERFTRMEENKTKKKGEAT